MSDSSPAPRKETTPPETAQESSDSFRADLPLAVLESMRHHDRPTEILEDEDLSVSLPRRLGLTGVVDSQIHRYRIAQRRRERIPADQVADLLRLVLRRPDSEAILREAGYELARLHAARLPDRAAAVARVLPRPLALRIATRSVRRLLGRIAGSASVRVTHTPLQAEIQGAVTARVDRWAVACVLYAAAIEHAVEHATGTAPHVEHTQCSARGEASCLWTIALD
jgi:hypothetical protein